MYYYLIHGIYYLIRNTTLSHVIVDMTHWFHSFAFPKVGGISVSKYTLSVKGSYQNLSGLDHDYSAHLEKVFEGSISQVFHNVY